VRVETKRQFVFWGGVDATKDHLLRKRLWLDAAVEGCPSKALVKLFRGGGGGGAQSSKDSEKEGSNKTGGKERKRLKFTKGILDLQCAQRHDYLRMGWGERKEWGGSPKTEDF